MIEYYGTDQLGSIRVVFNASGTLLARTDYLPYGEELATEGPASTEKFTGQARDAEAGQDYFHARMYLPRTGRFNAVDPVYAGLFDPQQWNRYAYARNSPLSFTDPTGMNAKGPTVPNMCSAGYSFAQCGGEDLFWDTGGGGGGSGFGFGGDYARAQERGYVPGMQEGMWDALEDFNQRSEAAFDDARSRSQGTVETFISGVSMEFGPLAVAAAVIAADALAKAAAATVAILGLAAVVEHVLSYDDALGFPDPYSPPDSFVPHAQGPFRWGPRYKDTETGETWTWHDEPGHAGGPHWDIGGTKGSGVQDWWPEGGVRGPKPPGSQR